MAHHEIDDGPFPRGALLGAFAMVAVAVLGVAAVRTGLVDGPPDAAERRAAAAVQPVVQRDLRFADRADGAVVVTDIGTNETVAVLNDGQTSGFVRGVLRGLARERMLNKIGAAPPFRLTQWSDGALTLVDSATQRRIELGSFGASNRAAFAALLRGARR